MELKPISNNKLTLLRKLNRKKYREKERLFLIEGARAVQQVIENKQLDIEGLFFDQSQTYWELPEWTEGASRFSSSLIDQDAFMEVSDTDSPQGVLALCRMPEETGMDELALLEGLIIAADRIQDPGNLGTMIRTASWFGVKGILAGKGTVDLYHPKVVRGTAGATGVIPYANVELDHALGHLEQEGWSVILLDTGEHARSLRSISYASKIVVVIGNEANGINPGLFRPGRIKARIDSPERHRQIESLNASISLGIALFALAGT